ncbi:hypothetical protein ElyMa_005548800 [Elysia marginata]|uniref:Uncharacterized protein n=1 Tax=Elysia marginata TaxID=1093978 RepID=A0AAV4EZ86_9GAST|nr:hypothetical protein ElyMa_005548800 [Elysia marginata]
MPHSLTTSFAPRCLTRLPPRSPLDASLACRLVRPSMPHSLAPLYPFASPSVPARSARSARSLYPFASPSVPARCRRAPHLMRRRLFAASFTLGAVAASFTLGAVGVEGSACCLSGSLAFR